MSLTGQEVQQVIDRIILLDAVKELAKMKLDIQREANGAAFEKDFWSAHVRSVDLMYKGENGKHEMLQCYCRYCTARDHHGSK